MFHWEHLWKIKLNLLKKNINNIDLHVCLEFNNYSIDYVGVLFLEKWMVPLSGKMH